MDKHERAALALVIFHFERQHHERMKRLSKLWEQERSTRKAKSDTRRRYSIFWLQMMQLLMLAMKKQSTSRRRRRIRSIWMQRRSIDWWHCVALHCDDAMWKETFRVSRQTFRYLSSELRPLLEKQETCMRKPIPVEMRLALTLRRLATHIEFRSLANLFGVGKSSAVKIFKDVCDAIVQKFGVSVVRVPEDEELLEVTVEFGKMHGLPNICGAIDGCHIPIIGPKKNRSDYLNRKGYYSLVLQALVSSKGQFMDVSIGWPGRMTYATIFENSSLFNSGEESDLFNGLRKLEINEMIIPPYIIGSSAYSVLPWLMCPFPDKGRLTEAQKLFNCCLDGSHSVAKRAFGRLKCRFRTLLRRLDNSTERVPTIVMVCCILHNICESSGDAFEDDWIPVEEDDMNASYAKNPTWRTCNEEAETVREMLISLCASA